MTAFTDLYKPTLVSAGVLLVTGTVLQSLDRGAKFSEAVRRLPFQLGSWLVLAGSFVLLCAALQLHQRHAHHGSRFMTVATAAAALGTMFWFALAFAEAVVDPAIATTAPVLLDGETPPPSLTVGLMVTLLGFAIGWLTYGIALLRTGTVPKGPAALVVVGAVLSALPFLPVGAVLIGLAMVWLGVRQQPSPARGVVAAAT